MIDPTFMIPDSLKERFVDWLVESVAGQAEQVGSDQAARVIRKLSSDAVFRASADQALQTGIERFIEEYREQDEDLVDAIVQDATFWKSAQVQQALKDIVERPGASMPDHARVIARHFDSVLPQRLNRKRVDAAVSYLLGCVAQELWCLPGAREVREIYGLQFQKMTAEESREQTALMRQQLEATLEFNAEMRQAFLQLTGGMEKALLAAPTVPALVASPRPYNNLPQPTYVRFVGRDTEIGWLRDRLSPTDRTWQIALTGIGGVGKTALALAVADEYRRRYHELSAEERFEAIVWVSAKEEVLTAQGRERADLPDAILHTLEDVYTAIARVLEREDITRALPEEQDALVQKALQRQRTLLVMDNMESVEDDRIKAFLRKLPAPTKAIITSREWIDVADVRILKGLSPEEAETLIQEEATARGVALNAQQRERLYNLTAGLPLPLKLGIARMSAGESFAAVDRWLGDAIGDLPEYCVRSQVDLVRKRDPNAWTVLLACSLFDREAGASREALGKIANLSLVDRDQALTHLQRLFLVNQSQKDRFWILPIVQRYANLEVAGTSQGSTVVARWEDWLEMFVRQRLPELDTAIDVARELDTEYPNLLIGVRHCRDQGRHESLYNIAEGLWDYMSRRGLHNEMREIVVAASQAVASSDDEGKRGAVSHQLGKLASVSGQFKESLEHLNWAFDIFQRLGDYQRLAGVWAHKAYVLSLMQRAGDAEAEARKMFEMGLQTGDAHLQRAAADRLAAIEAENKNFEQAAVWNNLAEERTRQLGRFRMESIYHRRAYIFILEGRFTEAEPLLLEVLKSNIAWREWSYVATNKSLLAEVYANTGRPQLARIVAEEALDLYDRLGIKLSPPKAEKLRRHLDGSNMVVVDSQPE